MLPVRRLFSSTLLNLTLIYTGILLFVSIVFSISFYQVSIRELDANYVAQNQLLQRRPIFDNVIERNEFVEEQLSELRQSKERVFGRLVVGNIIVLVGSTLLSYFLAKKSLEPIEEAHAAQARFTADASHELRTPLTAMQTEIEVTLRDQKTTKSEFRGLLSSNLEELKKLTKLSDALLRLARREVSSADDFTDVKIKQAADEAIKRVVSYSSKTLDIDCKIPKNLCVSGDADAIHEVFLILLDNAVKYGPDKPEIKITARKRTRNRSVMITISDNGSGIKASELPHIFERFYRADSSRSKSTEGYGLGLSLARQIVELHNGTITVESDPKFGTTFTIIFP